MFLFSIKFRYIDILWESLLLIILNGDSDIVTANMGPFQLSRSNKCVQKPSYSSNAMGVVCSSKIRVQKGISANHDELYINWDSYRQ